MQYMSEFKNSWKMRGANKKSKYVRAILDKNPDVSAFALCEPCNFMTDRFHADRCPHCGYFLVWTRLSEPKQEGAK